MAKLGNSEKLEGFRRLDRFQRAVEVTLEPRADFAVAIQHEKKISRSIGGRTVFDDQIKVARRVRQTKQLGLFES
jgi:uncharacterized protein